MSVQELENAISQLSAEDFKQLADWIDEYRADQWDCQIEADIRAVRYESLCGSGILGASRYARLLNK